MKNELWLIWKHAKTRRRYKIGILTYQEEKYYFRYENPELDDAKMVGFDFFPGFEDTTKQYENNNLFANIETRLPNLNRPDYLEILNTYGLNRSSTKLEILKATKGRLVTDNYEFVPAFDKNKLEFDVAGTRHCSDVEKCKKNLTINNKLTLELEPHNKFDKDAIKIIYQKDNKKYHIGYVPRYYTKELSELLTNKVSYSALIQSLNFESDIYDEDITATVKLIFK